MMLFMYMLSTETYYILVDTLLCNAVMNSGVRRPGHLNMYATLSGILGTLCSPSLRLSKSMSLLLKDIR
jgi:hypothetical protein